MAAMKNLQSLDLEGVSPEAALNELTSKVAPQDAYIASIRVGLNRPGVTRLVVELKTEVRPQIFTLKPMGDYGHRLVMDLYPASLTTIENLVEDAIERAERKVDPNRAAENKPDKTDKPQSAVTAAPKDGKQEKAAKAPQPAKPEYVRLITIAIDAGHGGVDHQGREGATRRIKAAPGGAETRIIALTASSFEEERAEILAAGCDDFLRKPYRAAALLELIEKHLGVRYIYGDAAAAPAALDGDALADALRLLPADLLALLEEAATRTDMNEVERLVRQVGAQDPAAGARLQALANDFDYAGIASVLRAILRSPGSGP